MMSPCQIGKSLRLGWGSATTKQPCRIDSIVRLGLLYPFVAGIKTISARANSSSMVCMLHGIAKGIFDTALMGIMRRGRMRSRLGQLLP